MFKIALLFLIVSTLLFAEEKRVYTIGVEDYEGLMLPYSNYKNGEFTGLGKEILDLFAKSEGFTFEYKVYPLRRRDILFTSGKLDFIFPDNPYWIPDMKEGLEIHYAPMVEYTDAVIVKPKNRGKGIDSLKKLGIPLGFTPWPYNDRVQGGSIEISPNASIKGLVQQVIMGRIDGAYINVQGVRYLNSQRDDTIPLVFDLDLPHSTGYFHLSSIAYPELVEKFKLFMSENEEAVAEIRQRYRMNSTSGMSSERTTTE